MEQTFLNFPLLFCYLDYFFILERSLFLHGLELRFFIFIYLRMVFWMNFLLKDYICTNHKKESVCNKRIFLYVYCS